MLPRPRARRACLYSKHPRGANENALQPLCRCPRRRRVLAVVRRLAQRTPPRVRRRNRRRWPRTPGGGPPARNDGGRGRNTPQRTGTASIRGRVMSAATGTPVRRASISATSLNENGRSRARATDRPTTTACSSSATLLPADGRCAREDGIHRPAVRATQRVCHHRSHCPRRRAAVRRRFRLSRGGAIAGRVVDEFGDPLAGANVTALRIQNNAQGIRTTRTGCLFRATTTGVSDLQPAARSVLRSVNDPSARE